MIQLSEIRIVGENKLVVYQETTCHSSLIFDGDLTASERLRICIAISIELASDPSMVFLFTPEAQASKDTSTSRG
ncbi:MAG TPA: hypothetical protein VFS97_11195 [Nitrososphaeraceae archaeon]|nr:hypothetical protein [Nitrososphaeraceae archaeon]